MTDRQPLTGFNQLLAAISSTVAAAGILPKTARVEPAEGPLDEGWLQRNSVPAGAAMAAIAQVSDFPVNAAGVFEPVLQLGLYFVPAPARQRAQATALVDQVQACLALVDNQRWGLSGLKRPERINAANRYSPALARQGSSLWIVNWRQTVRLETGGGLAGRDLTADVPPPADARDLRGGA